MKIIIKHDFIRLINNIMTILSYSLLGFVLSYILFSLVSYTLSSQPSDQAFGMIPNLRMPTFADLRWITATGGCSVNINDIYTGKSVGCDSFGRHDIGYPPMSLWTSRILGVKGDHTPIISLSISLSFIAVILSQMRSSMRSGWLLILVGSLFLLGFPVQLGLERMNIDILIFLLLYLAVLLFSFHAFAWLLPLIIFVISLKYFPFFAFFALMLKGLPSKPGISYPFPPWLIMLIGSCIGLALSLPWSGDGGNTVAAGGLASHGLLALGHLNKILIEAFGLTNARWIIKAFCLIKIAFFISGAYMAYRLRLADILANAIDKHIDKFETTRLPADFHHSLVVAMTSVWLGCYFITISFDYRMIFLFPALIFIARAIQLNPTTRIMFSQRRGLICLLIAMLAPMLIQFIGYSFQDPLTHIFVDAIAEFILIPFYASALSVIVLSLIVTARRQSLLTQL
ncbi:MAG: hypothetical protein ACK5RA_10550 [Cyanobacteriota bacterium]